MIHYSPSSPLPLSPIDCVFVGPGSYPIEFAFFYEKSGKEVRESLELAWQHLANDCPMIKSRLSLIKGRYNFEWSENDYVKPMIWRKIDGDAHPDRHPSPYDLVDPVVTAPGEALATLKVTEGVDGMTLGFSFSHALGDGFTYFMVLSALCTLSREALTTGCLPKQFSIPMNHDRNKLFEMADIGLGADLNAENNDLFHGFSLAGYREDVPRHSIRYAKKHFSKGDLSALFFEFNDSEKRLSTNDMLCAFLWRQFILEFDPNSEAGQSLVAPFDFRRIYPEFPRNYAGNAVVLARTESSIDQLTGEPLMNLAVRIRNSVNGVNAQRVSGALSFLRSKLNDDKYAGLGRLHIVDPSAGLLITNLSRMLFSSLDFGIGSPVYCRPLTPCKRAIVLLSDGNDGVVAHIHS